MARQRRQQMDISEADQIDPFGPGHSEPDVIELSSYYVNEVVSPNDSVQNVQKVSQGSKPRKSSPLKLEKLPIANDKGMVVPRQLQVDDLHLQL